MNPQRILITGSSGFYGRALIGAIRKEWPAAQILGLDVVAPKTDAPDTFEVCDITSPKVREHVVSFQPDTILHLAFVVNPMRDENRMHQINVDGSRNLLAAASAVKPARVFVASSATSYGAWPDNPVPMTEDQPLRARTDYRYASDKVDVENLLSDFAAARPEITVSWTRPCIIYGPGMSNFMTPLFTVPPILTLPGGDNPAMQFVHLDDVADASIAILRAAASPFPFPLDSAEPSPPAGGLCDFRSFCSRPRCGILSVIHGSCHRLGSPQKPAFSFNTAAQK
jgi:UDP-glucose 4-epimerase